MRDRRAANISASTVMTTAADSSTEARGFCARNVHFARKRDNGCSGKGPNRLIRRSALSRPIPNSVVVAAMNIEVHAEGKRTNAAKSPSVLLRCDPFACSGDRAWAASAIRTKLMMAAVSLREEMNHWLDIARDTLVSFFVAAGLQLG